MFKLHDSPRNAWAIFLGTVSLVLAAFTSAFFQGTEHAALVASFSLALIAVVISISLPTRGVGATTTDAWVAALGIAFGASVLASRVPALSANAALWLSLFFCAYVVARRIEPRVLLGALGCIGLAAGFVVTARHFVTGEGIAGPFVYRYLMTAIVIVGALFVSASVPVRGPRWRYTVPFGAAALAFLMVGLTGSRGLMVAGAAAIVVLGFLMPRAERAGVVWFTAGAAAGFLAAFLVPDPTLVPLAERTASLAAPIAAGEPRFVLWASVLPLIAERPLLGHGPGLLFAVWPPHRAPMDLTAGYYAHNAVLDYAVTAGIPAALLLMFMLRSAVMALLPLPRAPLAVWLLGALAFLIVHALVDFNLLVPTLWLLCGVCVGAAGTLAPTLAPTLARPHTGVRVVAWVAAIALVAYSATSFIGWRAHQAGLAALDAKDPQRALVEAAAVAHWWPSSDAGPLLRAEIILNAALERPGAESNPAASAALQTALGDVETALARNPLRPDTYRTAARLHLAGARLGLLSDGVEQARRRLDEALAINPRDLQTRVLLSEVLVQSGSPRAAVEVLVDGFAYRHDDIEVLAAYARRTRDLAQSLGDAAALARIPAGLLP